MINKPNGFAAPYRSSSFQDMVRVQIDRNGVLNMQGDITQVASDVTIPAYTFVQNGLLVESKDPKVVTAPANLIEPYYLTVTSLTPAITDNLSYQFAQSPDDVTSSEVIVAEKSDGEWRTLPFLSIDGLIRQGESNNISFASIGPISGLLTSVNGPNYENSPGELIDNTGRKTVLDGIFTTPIIDIDVAASAERVDRLVYRRPVDSEDRIGRRVLIPGGAYGFTPASSLEILDGSSLPHGKTRVLLNSSNEQLFFVAKGFGETFEILFLKYSEDLTTEQVASTVLVNAVSGDFDVKIDSSGVIHLAYISGTGKDLTWESFDQAGVTINGPVIVDNQSNPAVNPAMVIDAFNTKVMFVYQHLIGPGQHNLNFASLNIAGSVVTAPKIIVSGPGNYINAYAHIDEDSRLYVAYEEAISTQVLFEVFDDIGDVTSALATLVSGATDGSVFTLGTLVDGAKNPVIQVSDSKELFVTFLQDKGAGNYGPVVWNKGVAELLGINAVGTDILAFHASVDSAFNSIDISTGAAGSVDHTQIEGSVNEINNNALDSSAEFIHNVRGLKGSMIHVYSEINSGTFTNVDAAQTVDRIGPDNVTGSLNNLILNSNDASFVAGSLTHTPAVGEEITIIGSSNGNNGTYLVTGVETLDIDAIGDIVKVTVDVSFPAAESPAAGVTSQFAQPDGNAVNIVKTTAEIDDARALRRDTLPSDILLARILMPGSMILNYIPAGGTGVDSDVFGLYGNGVVVDWEATTAGELTLGGVLRTIDLVNNLVYDVQPGGFPMVEDQALYIVSNGVDLTPTPQVVAINALPWGDPIQVLGFIKDGSFQPHLLTLGGIDELISGETGTIGEDLPEIHRTKLGIISDTTFEAYSAAALATGIILAGDSLPAAISKIAVKPGQILSTYIDLNAAVLPDVGGLSSIVDGNTLINGDTVLFANAGLNAVYKISGVGVSIVWSIQTVFGAGTSPDDGTSVSIQRGTEYFKTIWRYKDSTLGWIPIDSSALENEPSGFPNRVDSKISFNDGSLTFTIEPAAPATYFDFAIKGKFFRKEAAEQIVLPNVSGTYFLYYDDGVLTQSTSFTTDFIKIYAFVGIVVWDADNSKSIMVVDERHGLTLDGATHEYLHNVFGTRYVNGLSLGNFTTSGDGTADADAQASVSDGLIFDEDLDVNIKNSSGVSAASNEGSPGASDSITSALTSYATSFTPSVSGDIFKGSMYLSKTGSPTGNLVFKLYSDTGGPLPNALLATSAPIDITILTASPVKITSIFPAGTNLVSGTRYHIAVDPAGLTFIDGSNNFFTHRIDGVPSEQASISFDSGANWSPNAGTDYMFEILTASDVNFEQVLDPIANIPIYHRDGASGVYRKIEATEFPVNLHADVVTSLGEQLTQNAFQTKNSSALKDAQSFDPSSSLPLDQVEFLYKKTGSPTGNLVAELFTDNTGVPGTTLLATSDPVDVSTFDPSTPTPVNFNFSTPFTVLSGTTYWIVLDYAPLTLSGGNELVFYRNTAGGYAGGVWAFFSGAWSPQATQDAWFKLINLVADGRASFNEPTGPWTLDNAQDGYHVAMWLFATNIITEPVIAIMGQREDLLIDDATANNLYGDLLLGNFPILEFKILYRLIFQTDSTYTNGVKSKLVDVLDLRADLEQQGVASPSVNDHALLSGLGGAGAHPASSIKTGVNTAGPAPYVGGLSEADIEVAKSLDTIDKRFGQLRMKKHPSNTDRIVVTGATLQLNNNITIAQEIRNLLLEIDEFQIDFLTGIIYESNGTTQLNGGAYNFTPVAIPTSEFQFYSVQIIPGSQNANTTINGGVLVIPGAATDAVLADTPRAAFGNNVVKLGAVHVQEDAGGLAVIDENNITQLGIGSGSGGAGIDEASLFLEDLKAFLRNEESPEWMTPNIMPLDGEDKIDPASTGEFDVANSLYKLDSVVTPANIQQLVFGSAFTNLIPNSNYVSQSFITGSNAYVLDGVGVQLSSAGSPAGTIDMQIWGVDQNGAPDSSNIIATSIDTINAGLISGTPATFSNSFGGISLEANTRYVFVIRSENLTTANVAVLAADTDLLPAEGTWFANIPGTTGTWTQDNTPASQDLRFEIFGSEVVFDNFLTTQSYGGRFLSEDRDNILVYLQVLWAEGAIDDAALYEVSIDGGNTFLEMPMNQIGSSIKYEGEISVSTPTLAEIDGYDVSNADSVETFDNSANRGYAVKLSTVVAGDKRKAVQQTFNFNVIGSPVGDIIYKLVKDNGGVPTGNIVAEGRSNIANMAVGDNSVVISLPSIIIEGDYWLVAAPSAAYVYSLGVNELGIRVDSSAGTYTEGDSFVFDGTVWTIDTGKQAVFQLEGFDFDLRAKITASQDSSLVGLGIFYGENTLKSADTEPFLERIDIDGDLNTTEVILTRFIPNPATCVVWDTNTGQGYRFPAINFDGRKIIFADGQFLSPGETIPIIIDNGHGVMDNSDANAALLAANRLGSTDPTHDRSVAGEGHLRRADNGKLVEASLHWNGVAYEEVYAEVD